MQETERIFQLMIHLPSVSLTAFAPQESGAMSAGGAFRDFLFHETRIADVLKEVRASAYGADLRRIVLNFHITPSAEDLQDVRPTSDFRKRDHAVEVGIVVEREFFAWSLEERRTWVIDRILERVEALRPLVARRKLDTRFDALIGDLRAALT